MKGQQNIVLIGVILTVFISGCVGQGDGPEVSTPTGEGIATALALGNEEVRSGQSLSLTLTAENQGSQWIEQDEWFAKLIAPTDWTITIPEGENPIISPTRDQLNPPTNRREAGIEQFRWRATAPTYTEGIDVDATLRGRVYYNYETDAFLQVNLYPFGESNTQPSKVTATKGPIELSIAFADEPIFIEQEGDVFDIEITAKNVGGGQVYSPESTVTTEDQSINEDTEKGKVALKLTGPSITSGDLELITPSCLTELQLFGSEDTTFCTIKVKNGVSSGQIESITVKATYGYWVESSGTVKVIGRGRGTE